MRIIKKDWICVVSVIICFAFFVIIMAICRVSPFGSYSFVEYDCLQQYLPFYSEYQRSINSILQGNGIGEMFYSFSGGAGFNYLAVYFYYLSSPLNLFVLLIKREQLLSFISILMVIKVSCASGTMGLYLLHSPFFSHISLKKISYKSVAVISLSIAYSVNSFTLGYLYNVMWLDCLVLFPIVILGLERLIKKNSRVLYIIALFLCIWSNYYFAFLICIFLPIWLLIRLLEQRRDVTANIKIVGHFLLDSILAVGMAALPVLVSFFAILKTYSINEYNENGLLYSNIIAVIGRHFLLSKPIKASEHNGEANVYCGMAVLILVVLYIVGSIKKKKRIAKVVAVVFLLFGMIFSPLNFALHGFHKQVGIPNRFVFMYIFLLLVISYEVIDALKLINKKSLIITCLIVFCLLFVCFLSGNLNGIYSDKTIFVVSLLILSVYFSLLLTFILTQKKIFVICGLLITIIELLVNGGLCIKKNELEDSGYYMSFVDERGNAINHIHELIDDYDTFPKRSILFRECIYDNIINNEETYHGLNGVSLFSSTQYGSMVETMTKLGLSGSDLRYYYLGASSIVDDLFGIRYIYMNQPYYEGRESYTGIYDDNGFVYENSDALSIGYAVDKSIIDYELEETSDSALLQNNILYEMTGEGGYFRSGDVPISLSNTDNIINVSFSVPESGEYYIDTVIDYAIDSELCINDQVVDSGQLYNHMLPLKLDKNDKVDLYILCSVDVDSNIGFMLYATKYYPEQEKAAIKKLSEHQLEIIDITANVISGTVEMDNDQILFLSIPYDDGWKVYVDGKKTDKVKLINTFMGVKMEKGKHDVRLAYIPEGLFSGILIMFVSWVIFFILLFKRRKNDKCS